MVFPSCLVVPRAAAGGQVEVNEGRSLNDIGSRYCDAHNRDGPELVVNCSNRKARSVRVVTTVDDVMAPAIVSGKCQSRASVLKHGWYCSGHVQAPRAQSVWACGAPSARQWNSHNGSRCFIAVDSCPAVGVPTAMGGRLQLPIQTHKRSRFPAAVWNRRRLVTSK